MGRMYSAVMEKQAITTGKDLMSYTVPANIVCILHELNITNETVEVSDTGAIQIYRASGSAGAGTATTPRALDEGNSQAAGGTFLTDLTTDEDTVGNILVRRAWNVLTPFKWLPTPPGLITVTGGNIIVVHSVLTLSAVDLSAELIFELIG